MKQKGVLLISGLDSILAGRLLKEQNIEFEALFFHTPFCTCLNGIESCKISQRLEQLVKHFLNATLNISFFRENYLAIIKSPKYGYGKNMNPCIDCKIFMFKKAKEYMKNISASFIATGEVLGERPFSQNSRALHLIEKDSDLEGLVLRPLSAKILPPTIPEKEGWVAREGFLNIQGRSRKRQLELVSKFNIKDYPAPAGGCLLTDPNFSQRLRNLMDSKPLFSLRDVSLLKLGRHFRITNNLKLIVGRNEEEDKKLEQIFEPSTDALLIPANASGPSALAIGSEIESKKIILSRIVASYCKIKDESALKIQYIQDGTSSVLKIEPQNKKLFSEMLI